MLPGKSPTKLLPSVRVPAFQKDVLKKFQMHVVVIIIKKLKRPEDIGYCIWSYALYISV